MICERCGKAASYFSSYNCNGEYSEEILCSVCAKAEGLFLEKNININNFFSSFGELNQFSCDKNSLKCLNCGSVFEDITDSGYVGCASCYDTFKDSLIPIIQRIHGTTRHCGKVPNKNRTPNEIKLENLYLSLEKAISERKYEDAGKIDAEIQALEEENG